MTYTVTFDTIPSTRRAPDRLSTGLSFKHVANYAASLIREAKDDLSLTVWSGTHEAVDVYLVNDYAIVNVDSDVYITNPPETAYIKAAVNNAVCNWKARREAAKAV